MLGFCFENNFSPNLEAFLFSMCSMFCSFSFISCMFSVLFFISLYFPFLPSISLQFPIHFRSISLYFPFHLLFSFRSFPFILSVKCVSRKAQVPRKRNYRNIDPNPGYRSETIQKYSKNKRKSFLTVLWCAFWFIDTHIRNIRTVISSNSNCIFLSYGFSYCLCTRHLIFGIF